MLTTDHGWLGYGQPVPLADALRLGDGGPRLLTGLAPLDDRLGGIPAGGVWAIAGSSGSGVTVLAATIAVHASTAHKQQVLYVNGHLRTRSLLGRLVMTHDDSRPAGRRDLASGVAALAEATDGRLRVSSGWSTPQPSPPTGFVVDSGQDDLMLEWNDRLLVLDTLDEQFLARSIWADAEARVRALRALRDASERASVLATLRLPHYDPAELWGLGGFGNHPYADAVLDACDVVLILRALGPTRRDHIVDVVSSRTDVRTPFSVRLGDLTAGWSVS